MKSSLIHAVFILVLAGVAGGAFWGWLMTIETKSARVASLEQQIASNTETKKRIAKARESLAEIATYETGIQSYFVPESDVVSFITVLENASKAPGATVKVTSVSKSGSTSNPSLSIVLTISGPFEAVMLSLGKIEYAPYALTLTSFSLRKGESAEKEPSVWNADLSLVVGSSPAATSTTP